MKELEKVLPYLESINPYLLSGGAGALATGLAASQIKRDPKKSRLADLGRKLAIALGGGLAAAGVHKAINTAKENFSTALPEADVSPEEKLVNTATNPNTARVLAALGTGGTIYGLQTVADKKELKQMNPKLGNNPTKALKDALKTMKGPNQLQSYIDAMTAAEQNPGLDIMKQDIANLEKQLNRAKPADKAALQLALDEKINRLGDAIDTTKALNTSKLQNAGFDLGHYGPGKANKALRAINPYASRLYGRSLPGAAGKALAIGGSLLAPEIAGTVSDMFSSNPEE
jgi:hypothetical protein